VVVEGVTKAEALACCRGSTPRSPLEAERVVGVAVVGPGPAIIEHVFGTVSTPAVRPLDETVDGVAARDVEGMDGSRAADVLVELRRVGAKLAAVEARLVARVDAARPWAEAGYLSAAAWLAASDNTSLDEARGDVRLARRLGGVRWSV
jgi:hypothetical protein